MTPSEPIQYARSGDIFVAYQVIGEGDRDLLVIMDGFIPIDTMDDEPRLARAMRRLGSFTRVIRFDRRGIGLSDPVSPSNPPTLEQWVQDALAVLDAAGATQAAVLASAETTPIALLLAATHPERVSVLMFVNGFARALKDDDYPTGFTRAELEAALATSDPEVTQLTEESVAQWAPSAAADPAFRKWWHETGRRGASPTTAQALLRIALESDLRAVLPAIQAPALVMVMRDDLTFGGSAYLAKELPNATFVVINAGDNYWWSADKAPEILDEIEEFITGARTGRATDRVLATVLFTDIVDSTKQSSELGDRNWRDLLDRHDAAVRRQLTRFRGREVKTTGDGFLATFDGPARALECACAIRDAARQLAIEVRAGVHTGEVEVRGDDIGGIAVHIAARVNALAADGEVWATRTVTELVVGSGLEFRDCGEHTLKGVPGEWRLFAVQS
jgi:class 3 adenylate cyclase